MPISGKELIKILNRLGWTCVRVTGSHYIMRKGYQTVVVPCHREDLPRKTLKNILAGTGPIDGVKL